MKRSRPDPEPQEDDVPSTKKRAVAHATFVKWKAEMDKECQTMSWLDCEVTTEGAKKIVGKLRCKVCVRFKSKIASRRNYSDKWVVGADSVRTSNIRDHARTDQHAHAMLLLKKEHADSAGLGPSSYAPIAKALNVLPDDTKAQLRVKFDLAYFIATEKLAFTKYPALCELEAHHGVNVGTSYTTVDAGKSFCHYIAETRREDLANCLSKAKFFSLLMDGSTDVGNVDDEVFLVLWCDVDGKDEKVHTRMSFFAVARPESVTGSGLFDCMKCALARIGIAAINPEACKFLVGMGTDGASANVAAAGLKGLVEEQVPWVFWMWCLAHRIELAVKDALTHTSFSLIDEMLMQLYYIYEKSPKKCRQLEEVVTNLQQCLKFDDAGIRPVRASGSRWVTHKVNAMKRVLSKFGAYTNHLIALSEDSSVKSSDQAKLRGYCQKWVNAKYLLGCSFFVDLLSPSAILSKIMQVDNLDVLAAFTSLLKTVKEVDKLSSKSVDQWPTFAATLKKINMEDGKRVYQCQTLQKYDQAVTYYNTHHKQYCASILSCLKSRLAWSDLQLVRDVIFTLAPHGWEKVLEEESSLEVETEDSMEAIDRLGVRFKSPLESAGVDVDCLREEFHELISYATQFISVSTMDYQSVWWRLFHAPTASSWSNILQLVRLIFTLPVSNGKLERVFSTLKLIKVDKRSSLGNDLLDDLLVLNTDRVPLKDFNADESISLWWRDKVRRPNQRPRKEYEARCKSVQDDNSDEDSNSEPIEMLRDWDEWLDN